MRYAIAFLTNISLLEKDETSKKQVGNPAQYLQIFVYQKLLLYCTI